MHEATKQASQAIEVVYQGMCISDKPIGRMHE